MAVRRNADWGEVGRPPVDLPWFADEVAAAAHLTRSVAESKVPVEIGLVGGDMVTTLGSGPEPVRYVLDALDVSVDLATTGANGSTRHLIALSHVIDRPRRRTSGARRFLMNAEFVGSLDVAPRGHPNDGTFEVVDLAETMSFRQRRMAVRRMPRGEHVPHPEVSVRRSTSESWNVATELFVDGCIVRGAVRVSVTIVPDAVVAWVR